MKITSIETKSYLIPVELPRFPEPEMSDCFVVLIHTDEGITGIGQAESPSLVLLHV